MNWPLTLVFVAATFPASALITNKLVADWQGGVGITAVGGQISQWNDQHLLLNGDGLGPHLLTQPNAASQPYEVTDAHGYPGVLFPWGYAAAHPKTFLNLPGSLGGFDTTNTTVYVVATGPTAAQESETLLWLGGISTGWIRFFQTGYIPSMFYVAGGASTLYPPLNRAVFVGGGEPGKTTIRWNNLTQTNTAQNRITSTSGGMVAANNGAQYYTGILYRLLIYKDVHSAAQQDAQVAELAARYGVLTNYTKQVVCRGDSIPAGVDATRLESFPFQLWERYPEIEWHNQGVGGLLIGTNGLTGQMYDVDPNFVDLLYDSTKQENWLFFFAGVNDLSQGVSGRATYDRLTNYVAARKAAYPWQVVVSTVHATQNHTLSNADFNACLRTNAGNWERLVDPGLNSPIEARLNDWTDTNYFYSDGLHLINAGQTVLAEHFGQIINVPHRTTGYFGP